MSTETSFAEVFEDGLDYGYECVCGERVRGYASGSDARAAVAEHEHQHQQHRSPGGTP